MKEKKQIRIVMLGASLDTKGGIMSVERLILSNADERFRILHLTTFTLGSVLKNTRLYWFAMFRLFLLCVFRTIDVVHIHFNERGSTVRKVLPSLIAIITGRPFVLHSHSSNYEEFFSTMPKLARKMVVAVFGKCALFISLSQTWDVYYKKTFGFKHGQSAVLYNPVKIPDIVPDRRGRQEVRFVFLGLIGPRRGAFDKTRKMFSLPQQDKGAFDLIRAFGKIPKTQRNNAKLIIAGDGDVDGARKLVLQCTLDDKITVLDWIDEKERDNQLGLADVFVMPSYNEGLPMSMLEAMAWELPVLVTPVGGIPEFVTDEKEGLLVTPGDVQGLALALTKMICDKDFRLNAGILGRKRIAALSIDRYMDSLHSAYLQILK